MREEEAARFKSLQEENDALREMAALAATEPGVTAPVLSSFDSSPYGTFTIGAGASSGITEGSIVLTQGGFVLGSVTDVAARTATVEAFFAPGKKIDMNVGGVAFVADGRGGGNARGEIARDALVKTGDTVLIPAFAHRPAGIVGELQAASSSAFTTLYIRLPFNLDTLRYVYVLPIQ
jgi:cell shape-determining protein MreC